MAECHSVSGLAGIFRTGWEVRGDDIIFQYLVGSAKLSSQAGKSLSRWTCKIGDLIIGGQVPTLDDIEVHRDELQAFIDVLFADDISGRWSPGVRELLVMVLLLRWKEFCQVVNSQPKESTQAQDPLNSSLPECKSDGRDSHLFIGRVLLALEKAGAQRHQFKFTAGSVTSGEPF